jgi:adenine-specific DNA-methyltransferase
MKDLKNILTWKQSFGLLPIHLFPELQEESSFIMLNGGYGDFCLKTEVNGSLNDFHSLAWSSNTKNFVVLSDDDISIYNWQKNKPEFITRKKVEENFEKFYKYLLQNNFKSGKDVVPFIIDIFKQFRNLTREESNAVEALNLLYVLLASLEDDTSTLDLEKWGLSNVNIPSNFDYYTNRLRDGIADIQPKLDLIIRHSSGILFQEAQKEVLFFDKQIDLWGTFSGKLNSKKSLYSSIHYTPPYLARTIVENALRELNYQSKPFLKIFDPSCGSCEFLIEALKQLNENGYRGNIKIIGWDNSPTAVNTSTFLLNYEKRTIWHDRLEYEVRLVKDSLMEEWSNDYDLLLMNPPFVSWEQMDKDCRDAVKSILDKNNIGRPNQASAFFYKSIQSLSVDGAIGCVIPSSLLTLDAYQKLRNEVHELVSISIIGKLGNFVFEDAFTDISFIIGHKPKREVLPYILWTKNEKGIAQNALRDLRKMHYTGTYNVVESDYSVYQPLTFPITKENWKTISFQESELLKAIDRFLIEKKLVKIQDIFNVQQGIRTGNNPVFKISEAEYQQLPENEKVYFRPAIDNESIKSGQLLKRNYVWYPYNANGILIKTETALISGIPYFYDLKLHEAKEALVSRSRKDISNWWHLSEHRAWLRKKEPKLVSTEFGKSDSFAFDIGGEFVVERGYGWLPKKEFKEIEYYYFYLALFSSPFFDRLLSVYSRQLAGGEWFDLGKKFTRDIPIPNVHNEEVRLSPAYNQLIDIGKELSNGRFHLRSVLDSILFKYIYPEI